jgi:3-carboxy-cis,cis-muconate cycloisomerase
LQDVLVEDKQVRDHLSPTEIDKLLDPKNYTGSAESMIDQVLADHKKLH